MFKLTGPKEFHSDAGMPRLPRIDAPRVIHHVIIRGIEKRAILQNTSGYEDFLDLIY
jgi:hypothetical protein